VLPGVAAHAGINPNHLERTIPPTQVYQAARCPRACACAVRLVTITVAPPAKNAEARGSRKLTTRGRKQEPADGALFDDSDIHRNNTPN
jgi:hypothetical protein